MSSIVIVGCVGRDAELKTVGQSSVVEFTIAENVGFGDKKVTNWFRISYWGPRAEKVCQYITKGKWLKVPGTLTAREYTAKDGATKTSLDVRADDIVFVGPKDSVGSGTGGSASAPAPSGQTAPPPPSADSEDDMPF